MEYLVSLAMITLKINEISLCKLNGYCEKLNGLLKLNNINAHFLFSNKYAYNMIYNYEDCFELNEDTYVIKSKISYDNLVSRFVSYLPTNILLIVPNLK